MIFDSDLNKHVHWVIFTRKIKDLPHPSLLFNNILLYNSLFQKHLVLTSDVKLNFMEHVKKLVKLWVFYINFNKYCEGHYSSLHIKLL